MFLVYSKYSDGEIKEIIGLTRKEEIAKQKEQELNKCPCFGTMQDFYNSQLYCSLLSKK